MVWCAYGLVCLWFRAVLGSGWLCGTVGAVFVRFLVLLALLCDGDVVYKWTHMFMCAAEATGVTANHVCADLSQLARAAAATASGQVRD
jgi:hypothetical protein